MTKPKTSSAVARVAEKIRDDALKLEDGELLGSEDAMLEKYAISRPTLRQAASLVAQEQLITVRRGVGGGYFARRPGARAVSRMAALYLKVHDAQIIEILSGFMPIRVELARLSCSSQNSELRDELAAFLSHEREIDEDPHFRDFVFGERKFNHLIGQLSGNKVLALFMEILLDVASMVEREEDLYRNRPDRVAAMRQERNRLAETILAQDEELATVAAKRCARMSLDWCLSDLGKRGTRSQLGTADSQRS